MHSAARMPGIRPHSRVSGTCQTGSTGTQAGSLSKRGEKRAGSLTRPSKLIQDIQRDLASMSMYDGEIDGLNGPQTRAAIINYEKKYEMTARGLASPRLLEHIRFNKRILEAVKSSPALEKPGADHKVHLVQTGLAELGYSPGPVDGVLGEQTKQAIREFERHRRLRVTGEVSDKLIRELHKMTGLSSLDLDKIKGLTPPADLLGPPPTQIKPKSGTSGNVPPPRHVSSCAKQNRPAMRTGLLFVANCVRRQVPVEATFS